MVDQKYKNGEIIYSAHFSKQENFDQFIRFIDHKLEGMYAHNFTLINDELNFVKIFEEELLKRRKEKKSFLQIVTYVPIDEAIKKQLPPKTETSVLDFMSIDPKDYVHLKGNTDCVVVKATTKDLLNRGSECSILSCQETMGDFAIPRGARKKEIYKMKNTLISLYVCLHKGEAVGTCELMITDRLAKIEDFDVQSKYQRKGFGTAIIKQMLKDCADLGIEEAYLVTDSSDTAKDMYTKCGFHKIGEKSELFVRL